MGFRKNLAGARFVGEEVVHFEVYTLGYYAMLLGGARLDIQRAFNIQPPIENTSDYYAFMFVETPGGFYLLRQRVVEGRVRPWEVWLELEAENPHVFFSDAYSFWMKERSGGENRRPVESEWNHEKGNVE